MSLRAHVEVVLLLGAPGAGKGTQARYVAEALGVPHVASGDLLREHRQRCTPLGRAAQGYMERGDLVPDGLVVDMIADRLDRADARDGALLDGFPRTQAQAMALETRLHRLGGKVGAAVYIDVPTDVLIERLTGRWMCRVCQSSFHTFFNPPALAGECDHCRGELYQRLDDQHDVVANRVAVYLRDTLPVIAHYESLGVLKRIDGNQPIDIVREALRDALGLTETLAA